MGTLRTAALAAAWLLAVPGCSKFQVKDKDSKADGLDQAGIATEALEQQSCSGEHTESFAKFLDMKVKGSDGIERQSIEIRTGLEAELQSAMSAIPTTYQEAFFDMGGRITDRNFASQCQAEQRDGMVACVRFEDASQIMPTIFVNSDPSRAVFGEDKASGDEAVANDLKHFMVESFGLALATMLDRVKLEDQIVNGQVVKRASLTQEGKAASEEFLSATQELVFLFMMDVVKNNAKAAKDGGETQDIAPLLGGIANVATLLDSSEGKVSVLDDGSVSISDYDERWRLWWQQSKINVISKPAAQLRAKVVASAFDSYYCRTSGEGSTRDMMAERYKGAFQTIKRIDANMRAELTGEEGNTSAETTTVEESDPVEETVADEAAQQEETVAQADQARRDAYESIASTMALTRFRGFPILRGLRALAIGARNGLIALGRFAVRGAIRVVQGIGIGLRVVRNSFYYARPSNGIAGRIYQARRGGRFFDGCGFRGWRCGGRGWIRRR